MSFTMPSRGSKKKDNDEDLTKTFRYVAVSQAGVRTKPTRMLAPSAAAVASALQAEGWIPVDIEEVSSRGLNMDLGALFANRPVKMKPQELAAFARQFTQLLRAGLPVAKALVAVGSEQTPKVQAMCADLADKVLSGVPIAQAFGDYPSVFDEVFVAYVASGETSGTLKETTERLAKMLEKKASLRNKIKSVTAYPKMVGIAIGLIVLGIMLFLVPMYAKIYKNLGSKLPGPTQTLVNISHNLIPLKLYSPVSYVYLPYPNPYSATLYVLIVVAAYTVFLKVTKDNEQVGIVLDKLKYRMPIFGKLNRRTALFKWSSTLAAGLHSGVQQSKALDLAARASGSRWQKAVAPLHANMMLAGSQLSDSLSRFPDLYPGNIRAMVSTGEGTGDLPGMLESVSSALDDEVDALIAGLSAKIEVALLMVMGLVVGTLLIILYLPILNLSTTAGQGLSGGSF